MRAADLSWGAPPSPVKTSISSTAIIALLLRYKRRSVPPKESNACFLYLREDASPKASTHRSFLSLTRFTLIYPSCSEPLLAMTVPSRHAHQQGPFCEGLNHASTGIDEDPLPIRTRSVQHTPYNRTIIARSRQRIDELVDVVEGVVEVRGDPKAITSWCGDDFLAFEIGVETHG
jgi:hypothetical protein